MTYLVYDIIIAALLLLAICRGYKKGFVLALCGFLSIFIAFIGASAVSNALAAPVSRTIQPVIEQNIQQIFLESLPDASEITDFDTESDEGGQTTDTVSTLPLAEALELLKDSKLYRGFAEALQKSINDGMVSAANNASQVISNYVAKQIAQIVLFLVSFILILVLWFFISHALDLAFRLPVLSTVNKWSGAALGLFKGGLLLFIACWLLKGSVLPQDAIQNSYLLKFFCTTNPLSLIL